MGSRLGEKQAESAKRDTYRGRLSASETLVYAVVSLIYTDLNIRQYYIYIDIHVS